jgi:hypothetical protein
MDEEKRVQSHELETCSSSVCISSDLPEEKISDASSDTYNIPLYWTDESSKYVAVSSMTRLYCAKHQSDKNGCCGESLLVCPTTITSHPQQTGPVHKCTASTGGSVISSSSANVTISTADVPKENRSDISNLDVLNLNGSVLGSHNETEKGSQCRYQNSFSSTALSVGARFSSAKTSVPDKNTTSSFLKRQNDDGDDMSVIASGMSRSSTNVPTECCTPEASKNSAVLLNGIHLNVASDKIHVFDNFDLTAQGLLLKEGNNNEKVNEGSDYTSSPLSSTLGANDSSSRATALVTSDSCESDHITSKVGFNKTPILTGYLGSWKRSRYLSGNFSVTGDTMEGIVQCLVFLKAFSVRNFSFNYHVVANK